MTRSIVHAARWTEIKFSADERPRVLYEYFASGRGEFAFDMLRYDCAWPATGVDATKLAYGMEHREVRSIKLHSWRMPTVDRWGSFGWSVGTHNFNRS